MTELTPPPEPSPFLLSVRTALIMAVFSVVFTTLMAGTYLLTRPAIVKSEETEKLRLVNEILPPDSYDNALLQDELKLDNVPELGLRQGGLVWRARKAGKPVALVLPATAPDGYGGDINLIIAMDPQGTVLGVRAVSHKETPGLGDYIDPKKDRNKATPWINQFVGKSFAATPLERWKVRKDAGEFAYMTGATISARAVTHAVARAVVYGKAHTTELFK